MKNTIYVCAERPLIKIVMEILSDYKITPLTFDQLNNKNFKNNNIILFGNKDFKKKLKKIFFYKTMLYFLL